MTIARLGELGAASVLTLGMVALLAAVATPRPTPSSRVEGARAVTSLQPIALRPDSLVAIAAARDPFRMTRRPSSTPFDPRRAGQADMSPVGPPKPVLRLVGLVRGAPMTAIVEGLPGVEGSRVVRAGDTVGPLRVGRLTAGGIRIVGLDTTWILTLRVR